MTDYIALTKAFYDLLLNDFEAAVTQYLAEDFVWENPLPECVPFGGVYHGAEGLMQYFKGLSEAIEMSPLHFDEMIAGDGVVAAIGVEANTLVLPTGKRYDMPFVHVIRFNDEGRVTHVREYNDTREMVVAFGGNP